MFWNIFKAVFRQNLLCGTICAKNGHFKDRLHMLILVLKDRCDKIYV